MNFNIQDTLNHVLQDNKKLVTISSLNRDINILKSEITILKEDVEILKQENLLKFIVDNLEASISNTPEITPKIEEYLQINSLFVSQKYWIKTDFMINQEFKFKFYGSCRFWS